MPVPDGEKKGITVRIDVDLHAEVSQYLKEHEMTMAEFVGAALEDALHPQNSLEANQMDNKRTLAFQVSEELFQRIKGYLSRNNMTQKEFILGLIERELDREQEQLAREGPAEAVEEESEIEEEELSEETGPVMAM